MDCCLFLQMQNQLNPTIGVLAFLLSALHLIISFPFRLRFITTSQEKDRVWVLLSCVAAFVMETCWLIYLWPLQDVLISVALVLGMIGALAGISLAIRVVKRPQ